ncbi:MAG: Holliday junction branch migration protein RuvA [Acidobacteria bacterium]|nr:Holliday junction branch migration protein RuvA [Acidobacteriota bacterium]MBI3264531.1 Holliday junction branch migration protein RuvA [Acidobacteriota bacterium]
MIAFLRGRLLTKAPTRLVVDVQGVGYDVHVPLSTFYRLPEPGDEVSLRIHTHVREDALALFGFVTDLELQIFDRLISISGVGPKLALATMSGIEPPDLVGAVQRGDVARLTAIPGVGRKTAERIVLELKDKLAAVRLEATDQDGVEEQGRPDDLRRDLLSALLNLGYHRPLAERAVDTALKGTPPGAAVTFEQTLRQALRALSR